MTVHLYRTLTQARWTIFCAGRRPRLLMMSSDRPIVILACRVFQHWLEELLPEHWNAQVSFFDYGLHAVPKNLRQTLQQAIDFVEQPSLIVLGYGLCGKGLDQLEAGKHFLLIPRTDDCIAILLGSYQAYRREKWSASQVRTIFPRVGSRQAPIRLPRARSMKRNMVQKPLYT